MPYLKKAEKPKIRSDIKRKTRNKIYTTAKWSNLRKSKLMFNPLCELCLAQGKVTPATDVHHNYSFLNIDGSINYDRCYDYGNLISLCH